MADINIKTNDFSKDLYRPILNCINEVFGEIIDDIKDAFENEFTGDWSINMEPSKSFKNFININIKYEKSEEDEETGETTTIVKKYVVTINLATNEVTFSNSSLEFGNENIYHEFLEHLMNVVSDPDLFNDVDEKLDIINTLAESYNVKVISNSSVFGAATITSNPDPIYVSQNDEKLYAKDTEITINATANEHYKFSYWSQNGNIIANNPEYVFSVSSNGTFVANFEKEKYNIKVSANIDVAYKYLSTGGIYEYNDDVELEAKSTDEYVFENWTIDGVEVSTDSKYSFKATEDVQIVANFTLAPDYDDEDDDTGSSSF